MRDTMQLATIDQTIGNLRAALRERVAQDPQSFGGHDNPRLAITIGEHAPLGSIGVPSSLDISTTQGLMGAIDLTLLDRSATMADIEAIATRAKHESAAAVCVYPEHVPPVQRITGGCPPAIAVVGFPSVPDPMSTLSTTLQETRLAIRHGAKEIDMVLAMNFKDPNPNDAAHYHYIQQVVSEAAKSNVPVKVILETAYLTDAQKIRACLIAKLAGAAYVKTSTGFALEECMRPELDKSQKGATAHDVALMRRAVGDTTCDAQGHTIPMGVKASGGVRTREQAMAMYEAGASRIGASGSIDVRSELEKQMARRHAAPTRTAAGGIGGY